MKHILCALFIFFAAISLFAGTIRVSDYPSIQLTSVESSHSSFRPIQFCKNGQCELIPNESILALQGFSEKDMDWSQIFNQCRNYKSLNQLTTWTQIISSMVVAIKPIAVLRNLRSTKNLLASWGLFGRIVGNRIVFDSGITVAGQVVYSIPTRLVDSGDPYPEISPDDVDLVSNLVEEVISDSEAIYYLPTELIEGLAVILKGCTSQLKQEYIHSNARGCLTNCHAKKNKEALTRTQSAPDLHQSVKPGLKWDLQKEQIEDYLQ